MNVCQFVQTNNVCLNKCLLYKYKFIDLRHECLDSREKSLWLKSFICLNASIIFLFYYRIKSLKSR